MPLLRTKRNDLYNLLESVKFTHSKSDFQRQLSADVREIQSSDAVYVLADKTSNIYKLPVNDYEKLLHDNVTAVYKKTTAKTKDKINHDASSIAKMLQLDSRIEQMAEREPFITIKDHKPNFENNTKCRLINPAKSEIGVISRHHLQQTNEEIRLDLDSGEGHRRY